METFGIIIFAIFYITSFFTTIGVVGKGVDEISQDDGNGWAFTGTIFVIFFFLSSIVLVGKVSNLNGIKQGEVNQLKGNPVYEMKIQYELEDNCPVRPDTIIVKIK